MVEQGPGQYFCEYDNTTISSMVHRYIFLAKVVDETGECSVQVFNEQASDRVWVVDLPRRCCLGFARQGLRTMWCNPIACKAGHTERREGCSTILGGLLQPIYLHLPLLVQAEQLLGMTADELAALRSGGLPNVLYEVALTSRRVKS